MKTNQVTYLSIYREKRAVLRLYKAYLKSLYSKQQAHEFNKQLVQWYDEEATMSAEVLQEAASAFRYSLKVYK